MVEKKNLNIKSEYIYYVLFPIKL